MKASLQRTHTREQFILFCVSAIIKYDVASVQSEREQTPLRFLSKQTTHQKGKQNASKFYFILLFKYGGDDAIIIST